VAAYYLALQERTGEHVPLDWAVTQNNIGTLLLMLGERESGTARLEEAVLAFDASMPLGAVITKSHVEKIERGCVRFWAGGRVRSASCLSILHTLSGGRGVCLV
jgi:hypothetical protein